MVIAILNAILAKQIVLNEIITVNDINDWVRKLDVKALSDSKQSDIIKKFAKKFDYCSIKMLQDEIERIQKRVTAYEQIVKKSRKRKWIPEPLDIEAEEMKKKIHYYILNAYCASGNNNEAKLFDENTFRWLGNKLGSLHNQISSGMPDPSGVLLEDIAIVPVEPIEFEYMENPHLVQLMQELSFLAPNTYQTSCWWKIPRQ